MTTVLLQLASHHFEEFHNRAEPVPYLRNKLVYGDPPHYPVSGVSSQGGLLPHAMIFIHCGSGDL